MNRVINKNENGAVFVEMAFVSLLFIFIIGFLFDVLILFFRTQVLTSAVTEVSRDISINHYQDSETLQEWAPRQLRRFINDNYVRVNEPTDSEASDLTVNIRRVGNDLKAGGACLFEIEAEWSQLCVFCLIPTPPARTTAQAYIEDECFSCL